MNFDLDDEQLLLEETVEKFLATTCPPSRVRELFDGDTAYDDAVWRGLADMGVFGLCLPEDVGGAGAELIDAAVVAEVLGRHATPGPYVEHIVGSLAIALGGSAAQRQRWLPALAGGTLRASIALAESSSGSGSWLPSQWRTSGQELTGRKYFVPFAEGADLLIVGTAGGGLAVVQVDDTVTVEPVEGLDRTRRLSCVSFAQTSAEPLSDAATVCDRVLDAGLTLVAADAYGGATACLDSAVEYAKLREQFGAPIGAFQALQHQLANQAVQIHPARGLMWYAAHAWDHLPSEASCAAANAKAHLTDRYVEVARAVVEAHGGIGYTWECDVQFWLKRAYFDWAIFGDARTHRRRVAELQHW